MINKPTEYRSRSLAPDKFSEFLKEFREYEKSILIREKENLFLDGYSQWLRSKEERDKLQVIKLALELELLGEHIDIKKIFSHNLNKGQLGLSL